MLLGALAWAVLVLTLLPALEAPTAALFPTLLLSLCAGGVVGPGVQAALRGGRARRPVPPAAAGLGRRRVVILGGGFGGVSAARRWSSSSPGPPGWT